MAITNPDPNYLDVPPIKPPRKGRKPKAPAAPRKRREPDYRVVSVNHDETPPIITMSAAYSSQAIARLSMKGEGVPAMLAGKAVFIARIVAGPLTVKRETIEKVTIA